MKPPFPFDAVIFDCDGVLVDSEPLVNDIEARLFSELGLPLSPDEVRARFKGRTLEELAATTEAALGDRLPAGWWYDWAMHTALGFVQGLRAVPGVQAVVDDLAGRGVHVGVASQSPRPRVDLSLVVTGLADRFAGRVFTAALVPRAKPSPDVYLFAAARLGVAPERCAVVEDSPSGVAAAVAAGMAVFGYAAEEGAAGLARAGAIPFETMAELPGLLAAARSPAASLARHAPRVRALYDALAAGDGPAVAAFLADDVVYHLPGRHLGGGTLRGRDAVLARVAAAAASCDAPPALRLVAVAEAGDLVLSVERFAARRRGPALEQDVVVVWRMAGDRCVEVWSRFAAQTACDRFWSDA